MEKLTPVEYASPGWTKTQSPQGKHSTGRESSNEEKAKVGKRKVTPVEYASHSTGRESGKFEY